MNIPFHLKPIVRTFLLRNYHSLCDLIILRFEDSLTLHGYMSPDSEILHRKELGFGEVQLVAQGHKGQSWDNASRSMFYHHAGLTTLRLYAFVILASEIKT